MQTESSQPEKTLSAIEGIPVLFDSAKQSLARISLDRWLVVFAGLIAWGLFFFGERVAMRNGLGWDGEVYWTWVTDFPRELREGGVDSYRIQRILPSCILHYFFRTFRMSPTVKNTLRGFALINTVSIMLVAHFWCLTATSLKISVRGKWLGIVGLLLNFAVLKLSGYYVVLIDMPAYASGSAMAYFYITRRRVGLWIATIAGAFLWPTQLYVGTILSLFPRESKNEEDEASWETATGSPVGSLPNAPFRLDIIAAGLMSFYFCMWAAYACKRIRIPMFGGLYPIASVLGLSFIIAAGYIFLALRPLLNDRRLYRLPRSVNWGQVGWTFGTLLVLVGVKIFQASFSSRPGYFGFNNYCFVIGIGAVAKPGLFFLSHLVYYGPFWILAAYFWPSICRAIHRQQGIGLTLVTAIGVCHSLDAESRHIIYLLPLIVPFVVQVIDRLEWTKSQILFLTVISVVTSKCWLTIGGPFFDNSNMFPDQFFWMNVGTFMTDQTYVWQLGGALACVIAINEFLLRDAARHVIPSMDQSTDTAKLTYEEIRLAPIDGTTLEHPTSAA